MSKAREQEAPCTDLHSQERQKEGTMEAEDVESETTIAEAIGAEEGSCIEMTKKDCEKKCPRRRQAGTASSIQ